MVDLQRGGFLHQWILVIIGIILNFYTGKFEFISMLIYLIMGWMIVFEWDHLINSISSDAFNLLLYGGIIYYWYFLLFIRHKNKVLSFYLALICYSRQYTTLYNDSKTRDYSISKYVNEN